MLYEKSGWSATENSGGLVVPRLTQAVIRVLLCFGMTACTNAIPSSSSQSHSSGQSAVQVAITPESSSLVSGSRLQFAATVTFPATLRNVNAPSKLQFPAMATNDNTLAWSASAGSVTPGGLFTAPVVKRPESITVFTAKSVLSGAEASATVTVTPAAARFGVASASLPTGIAGVNYVANLTASGGSQPYQWSVASGSLPSGIQLNSVTGVISGVASESGSYPISVQVMDSTGVTSSASLTLTINSRGGTNCGPPSYPCSRTDTQLLVPTAPPQLGANPLYYGGHSGAGRVAADPVYNNNRILRVTDGNTDALHPGESFATGSSAEKNVTSYDESLFMVHSETGICLFQYDSPSFSATFRGCFNNVGLQFDFGYTEADQRAFYSYHQKKLYRFVVNTANWTIAPDSTFNGGQGYFDPDNASCLNGQIAANKWYVGDMAVSSDDSTVIAAVGPEQDQNPYYVVWNAAKGCQWMNVQTWQVSQGWNTGLNNSVNIKFASGNTPTRPGGIHNAQIDRSGAYGVLTIHHASLPQKLFWTIGTDQVDDTCVKCMSHWACDFGVCFWDMGPGSYALESQDIGSLMPVPDMATSVATKKYGNDEHLSHANATQGEKLIYLAAWQPGKGGSTINQVWEGEIAGINWDGSLRTIRFNKNWASGYGFNATARCSISRQGSYAICGSDYQMYNLDKGFGNGLNQDSCNHNLSPGVRGTNGCRTDVLLFELR